MNITHFDSSPQWLVSSHIDPSIHIPMVLCPLGLSISENLEPFCDGPEKLLFGEVGAAMIFFSDAVRWHYVSFDARKASQSIQVNVREVIHLPLQSGGPKIGQLTQVVIQWCTVHG